MSDLPTTSGGIPVADSVDAVRRIVGKLDGSVEPVPLVPMPQEGGPLDPIAAANRLVGALAAAVGAGPPLAPTAQIGSVSLPADEREHTHAVEWWYFTGHLTAQGLPAPERFGFEFTVVRLESPGIGHGYYAYHSLIDLDGATPAYVSDERWEAGAYVETSTGFTCTFPAAGSQPGNWVLRCHGLETPPRYEIEAGFWKDGTNHALGVTAEAGSRPALLHGTNGVVNFGGKEMAYYSRTRLDAEGGVSWGIRHREVKGTAWMDHQWGDVGLLDRRWQFAAVQLGDDSDLALYVIESRTDGAVLLRFGARVGPGGVSRASDVIFTPLGTAWAGYPIDLHVGSQQLGVDLRVKAVLEDQRRVSTGAIQVPILTFWEGVCEVRDASGVPVGRAFLELGGYE